MSKSALMPQPRIALAAIVEVVTEVFGLASAAELVSMRRDAPLCRARFALYGLARKYTGATAAQIGRAIGDRDHTTVVHGFKRFQELFAGDRRFYFDVMVADAAIDRLRHIHVRNAVWEIDALAAARRVVSDPLRGVSSVSSLETRAMALAIIELARQVAQLRQNIPEKPEKEGSHGQI